MSSAALQRIFWDAIRPIHSPITRILRRRLGQNYAEHPEMELPPPYEAIGIDVERNLGRYLHVAPVDIERIVIVGANTGDEIPRMRRAYPRCRFVAFEPSPVWFRRLTASYGSLGYVDCREVALSDVAGQATFHELPMDGNGSLLRPDVERWASVTGSREKHVATFDVRVSTLDAEIQDADKIDLLWVDVQGAEGKVLAGAVETLPRVSAVFLEVWLTQSAYEGAPLFHEIDGFLRNAGFTCAGLGIDGWNFTGNALWIRDAASKACQPYSR